MDFARLKKSSDIRLFILFLLEHVQYPLDFNTLCDAATIDGVVDVFDFSEQFAYLLELGNISEIKESGTELYTISEQGKRISESLESTLSHTLRDYCLKRALTLLDFKKRGAEMSVTPYEENGKYYVKVKVTEKDTVKLDLKVEVEDESLQNKMLDNFNDKPDIIYKGIVSIMSGDINYLLE